MRNDNLLNIKRHDKHKIDNNSDNSNNSEYTKTLDVQE